jgi:hypothetical protein
MLGMTWLISWRFAFCAFALALGLPVWSEVQAADRFTPPFSVPLDGSVLCTAVNVSGSPHTVVIEMRDVNGNPVPSTNANCSASNPHSVVVAGGHVSAIACSGSGYRHCLFTVAGSKSAIRGVMRVFDTANATIAVLAAE